MSLLNDALRKKKREIERENKTGMFQKRPASRWSGRIKPYGIAIFLVAGLIAAAGICISVWNPPGKKSAPVLQGNRLKAQKNQIKPDARNLSLNSKSASAIVDSTIVDTVKQDNAENHKPVPKQKDQKNRVKIKSKKAQKQPAAVKSKTRKNKDVKIVAKPSSFHKKDNLFYEKALSYHRLNLLDQARRMYLEVLKNDPDHYDAVFNLAAVYMNLSEFSKALSLLEKLKDRERKNPQILLNLAVAELGLKRPKKAVSYLNDLEKTGQQNRFDLFFHRGVAFSQMEKFDDALVWYKKAQQQNPGHSRLSFNIAVAYDKLQKYPEAVRHYEMFLNQNTKNQDTKNMFTDLEIKKTKNRVAALKYYMAGQKVEKADK